MPSYRGARLGHWVVAHQVCYNIIQSLHSLSPSILSCNGLLIVYFGPSISPTNHNFIFKYIWTNHLSKYNKDVHFQGQTHQTTTTKTTIQQAQLQMFAFHDCQPPYLCFMISSVCHIWHWNCPTFMHNSKYMYILVPWNGLSWALVCSQGLTTLTN